MSFRIQKYLKKKAFLKPLETLSEKSQFEVAVVIPVLAELAHLPQTLQSLQKVRGDFAVILVINNRLSASTHQKQDNLQTLEQLRSGELSIPNLFWIDCASTGNEFSEKMGVGLARRIGMDSALTILSENGFITALDADTLVEPDYLEQLKATLCEPISAGYFRFQHQKAENAALQHAIDSYEEYLHHYVEGLQLAGSPYAYHSIGSTMAATAEAYVLADGIPVKRLAGEDFYFLQNVAKSCRIVEIPSTVYPSARVSTRTPFGTGQRMIEYKEGRSGEQLFSKSAFEKLGEFLKTVEQHIESENCGFINEIHSDVLHKQLDECGFQSVWSKIQLNYKSSANKLKAFHRWFDALKTLKLIKGLSAFEQL
jgi:glycosyltransferase involved in cell wall biosynthesis